jgi:sensor domain CHASE-containing protein/signal transduction histidine kinase
MSLRTRVIFSITVSVLILIGALYGVSQVLIIDGFTKLEEREASSNVTRARNAFNENFEFLQSKIKDWAAWDDAYKYVQDKNEAFAKANFFDAAASNLKVNYMMFYDKNGIMISEVGWDLVADKVLPGTDFFHKFFSPTNHFLVHKNETDLKTGFVISPEGPAFVVSGPVVTGEKKGPIEGTLVFVQYMTPTLLDHFAEVTHLSLMQQKWADMATADHVWDAAKGLTLKDPNHLMAVDDDHLAGYTLLEDFEGKPALAVRLEFKRDIMQQGRSTIKTVILSIAIFGALFGIGLLLIIERSVVARILRLSGRVDQIGKSENSSDRVTVEGKDEITSLSLSINEMLGSLAEKSRAIQTIMDNVDFGLLRCDRNGKIMAGYSKSCAQLLKSGAGHKVDGQTIWAALGLSERDSENFQNLYEQAAGDSLLAEDLVQQLPRRFTQTDRTLSLFGSVIFDAAGEPESVLFTVANITALAKAERENELNQSLLKILHSKDRFGELALRLLADAEGKGSLAKLLQTGAKNDQVMVLAKRNLHTWKGDFSVFGMREISEQIHHIEEGATDLAVVQSGIKALGKSLTHFLEMHNDLLGLNKESLDTKQHQVAAPALVQFNQQVRGATSLAEAQKMVDAFVKQTTYEEANRLFGHFSGAAVELGQRLGKEVKVEITGGKTRLPADYADVYSSLVHVFRNAVDHGLEPAGERGSKAAHGTIRLDVKATDKGYQIEISDDGKGVDLDAIQRRAEKHNLVKAGEWKTMSDDQKTRLIFHSGFTTRNDVTQTSGRGIGLDVVNSSVKAAGGEFNVVSKKGMGTKFLITLPLDSSIARKMAA